VALHMLGLLCFPGSAGFSFHCLRAHSSGAA
jgi:hypothetical protein